MEPSLNILIYGKNILTDIYQIVYSTPSIDKNIEFKDTYYFVEDNNKSWSYFLIDGEYNEKAKKTIENILKKHY